MRQTGLPRTSRTPADGAPILHVGLGGVCQRNQTKCTRRGGPRSANHPLNDRSKVRTSALTQRGQRPISRSSIGDVGGLNSAIVDSCLALQVLQVKFDAILVGHTGAKNELASTGHGALQGEFVHLIKMSNP